MCYYKKKKPKLTFIDTYYVPGTVLSVSHRLSHLILNTFLRIRTIIIPNVTNEEIKK